MNHIGDALVQKALALKREQARADESEQRLAGLTDSLAESGSLSRAEVTSVVASVQTELDTRDNRSVLVMMFAFVRDLPRPSARVARVICYVLLGFLGWSVFENADVDQRSEQTSSMSYTSRAQQDFRQFYNDLRFALVDPYSRYHEATGRFPTDIESLSKAYRVPHSLARLEVIENYKLHEDGTFEARLNENYGYGRWLRIRMTYNADKRWDPYDLECEPNVERELLRLYDNPKLWCTHLPTISHG